MKNEVKKSAIELLTVNNEEAINIAKSDINLTAGGDTAKKVKDLQKQYEEQYCSIKISSVKDLKGYDSLKNGLKEVKNFRLDTDGRRKELTAPALKFQKDLKAHADTFIDGWKSIEDKIKEKIVHFEDLQQAEQQKLKNERHEELIQNGWELSNGLYVCGIQRIDAQTIGDLKPEDMEHYLTVGKQELERQEAEIKRKKEEADRLKKEREEIEKERAELAKKKKELAEFEAWKKQQAEAKENEAKIKDQGNKDAKAEHEAETAKKEQKKPAKEKKPADKTDLSPEEKAYNKARREIYDHISRKDIKLSIAVIKTFIEGMKYEG